MEKRSGKGMKSHSKFFGIMQIICYIPQKFPNYYDKVFELEEVKDSQDQKDDAGYFSTPHKGTIFR